MRNILILILILLTVLGMEAGAQQVYQPFATSTVNGDTSITSTANVNYLGIVTFDYTATGNTTGDSCYIDFQGTNTGWVTYDNLSTLLFIEGTTSSDQHLLDDPAEYLNYRLVKRAYEVTDTFDFTNQTFIFKR